MKKHHSRIIVYKLKYTILTCCIVYRATYNEIEQKTGMRYDTAQKIVICAIKQTKYEDIYKVFPYVED